MRMAYTLVSEDIGYINLYPVWRNCTLDYPIFHDDFCHTNYCRSVKYHVGNFVIVRETGEKIFESMPIYARLLSVYRWVKLKS